MKTKLTQLRSLLNGLGSVVIAYSGGIDSTLLVSFANEILGEGALAVTASSPIHPASETAQAESLAHYMGIRHITIETSEMDNPLFIANGPQRCYYCKRMLFERLKRIADEEGLSFVIDGTNYNDLQDYRPGMKAAEELGVLSPLANVCLTKADIRSISQSRGLPNWNKPSFPCLATRFPYGTPITLELLARVADAEQSLAKLGLTQFRVRHHGSIARIELSNGDTALFADDKIRLRAVEELRALGYSYVTLDLAGYRPRGRAS